MEKMELLAREILAEAKSQGAEYAQCAISESEKKEFNVDGGRFSLMRTMALLESFKSRYVSRI